MIYQIVNKNTKKVVEECGHSAYRAKKRLEFWNRGHAGQYYKRAVSAKASVSATTPAEPDEVAPPTPAERRGEAWEKLRERLSPLTETPAFAGMDLGGADYSAAAFRAVVDAMAKMDEAYMGNLSAMSRRAAERNAALAAGNFIRALYGRCGLKYYFVEKRRNVGATYAERMQRHMAGLLRYDEVAELVEVAEASNGDG